MVNLVLTEMSLKYTEILLCGGVLPNSNLQHVVSSQVLHDKNIDIRWKILHMYCQNFGGKLLPAIIRKPDNVSIDPVAFWKMAGKQIASSGCGLLIGCLESY